MSSIWSAIFDTGWISSRPAFFRKCLAQDGDVGPSLRRRQDHLPAPSMAAPASARAVSKRSFAASAPDCAAASISVRMLCCRSTHFLGSGYHRFGSFRRVVPYPRKRVVVHHGEQLLRSCIEGTRRLLRSRCHSASQIINSLSDACDCGSPFPRPSGPRIGPSCPQSARSCASERQPLARSSEGSTHPGRQLLVTGPRPWC